MTQVSRLFARLFICLTIIDFSIYQSNGNCKEHCSDSAFGILQDKNCWCSDIAPSEDSRVSTSKCDDNCPGFPSDSCGNSDEGYYAYIQLGEPSGTASASSTSSTSTSSSSTSSDDSVSSTSSAFSQFHLLTRKTSSTSDSTTTSDSSVVETQTHDGQVTTVTVGGSDATSAADSGSSTQQADSDSGLDGGSIAGIVVGVVGGLALIIAAVVFFLAKKRQRDNEDGYQGNSVDGRQSKGSQMSYANIADNHSHTLSAGSSNAPHRMPTFTDNRLNTGAVLYPNGHRNSDVSLQDNEDYSRPVLRVRLYSSLISAVLTVASLPTPTDSIITMHRIFLCTVFTRTLHGEAAVL